MAGGVADLFAVRRLRLTLVSSPRNLGAAKSLTRFGGLARSCNRKTATRRSLRNPIRCFDQAARAAAFRFPRQPSRPNAPWPVAKSGSAAERLAFYKAPESVV